MWFAMITLCYVHVSNPMTVMCNQFMEKPVRYFNTEETCMRTQDEHRATLDSMAARSNIKIVIFNFECKVKEENA